MRTAPLRALPAHLTALTRRPHHVPLSNPVLLAARSSSAGTLHATPREELRRGLAALRESRASGPEYDLGKRAHELGVALSPLELQGLKDYADLNYGVDDGSF